MSMHMVIGHSPYGPIWGNMGPVLVLLTVQCQCQCHEHDRNTFSVSSRYRAPTESVDRNTVSTSSRGSVIRDVRDGATTGRRSVTSTVHARAGCGRLHPARSVLLSSFSTQSAKRSFPDPAVQSSRALWLTKVTGARREPVFDARAARNREALR